MYKVHQDAKWLPVQINSPFYQSGTQKIAAVNVSASKDSLGVIHISLVNLDPVKTISIKTIVQGANWKQISGSLLTSASFTDINSFEVPLKIKTTVFNGMKKEGDYLSVALPAKSVVVLELK